MNATKIVTITRQSIISDINSSQHSQYSPSGSESWIACPGKLELENLISKDDSRNLTLDDYKSLLSNNWFEGTVAHNYVSNQIFFDTNIKEDVHPNRQEIIENSVGYIKYINDVRNLIESPSKTIYIEQIFKDNQKELYGTVDCFIPINKKECYVIDFKYGIGKVDPYKNSQLLTYASMILDIYIGMEKFNLVIFQPKLSKKPLVYTCYKDEILEHKKKLYKAIDIHEKIETKDDLLKALHPGKKQCKWCRAKTECSPHLDYMRKKAGFSFIKFDENVVTTQEQIENICLNANEIIKFIKEVKENFTIDLLSNNKTSNKVKLVKGRITKRWIEGVDVELEKFIKQGLNKDLFYSSKHKTPLQVIKSLKSNELDNIDISKLFSEIEGNAVLTDVEDSRESYNPNLTAAGDFK